MKAADGGDGLAPVRAAQNEFSGMEDERIVFLYLHRLGQVFQVLFDVDIGATGVGENEDIPVQIEVDAGRLNIVAV